MPGAKVMVSPRLGFRWYTDDSRTTLIRGGLDVYKRQGISHIRIFQIGNTEILLVYGVIRSGGSFHTRNGIDLSLIHISSWI